MNNMRRFLSMAACLALTAGLCLTTSLPAKPVTAESAAANVALGKAAVSDSSYLEPGSNVWRPENLTDGYKMTDWPLPTADHTLGWCSAYSAAREVDIHVQLDLDDMYAMEKIVLYPRGNGGSFFPEDYSLAVSADGVQWETVVTKTGDTADGPTERTFSFEARSAQYVRLNITKLSDDLEVGQYCACISEIEVWGIYDANARQNQAKGAAVTADSSYIESYPGLTHVWRPENLVDGYKMTDFSNPMTATLGWSSAHFDTREVDITVQLDLNDAVTADEILLYPRGDGGNFFPEDYTVEVSEDGTRWETVASKTGDTETGRTPRSISFEARPVRYVKLHITKLDDVNEAGYYAALSEIRVMGYAQVTPRINVAPGAVIGANSSYIESTPGLTHVWRPDNLTDGYKMVDFSNPMEETLGWCSSHFDSRDVDITVDFDLRESLNVDEIVLYPRGNGGNFFPEDYTLSVSQNGQDWDTVQTVAGDTVKGAEKRSFAFFSRSVRYVKLHITRLSEDLDGGRYCAAISEMEIWGRNGAGMNLNKNELWMTPGAEDQLIPSILRGPEGADYTYAFEETGGSLLQVEADGRIKALACGETQVTVTEAVTGLSTTCYIKVAENTRQDNILITVPVWNNSLAITEEQFLWLREADVDGVMAVGHNNTNQATQKMLDIAKSIWDDDLERNLGVFIHSYNQGITPASSDEEILAYAAKYRNTPTLMGYHIEDEPWYPQPFARVERLLKQGDPTSIADINFLPGFVYGSYQEYQNKLADYAKLVGDAKSYLSFDNYPFTPEAGSVDEYNLFGNFEALRKAGLENDFPTAFYLQGVGSAHYNYRRPDEGVLRYHMASAMAYGFKWIKYFSWFVPGADGTDEFDYFTDGIMDRNCNKTELYDVAATLHKQIHNVGDVLVRLEAREVYHTGSKSTCDMYEKLPEDFFVRSEGDNQAIVTLFTNPETGRQYLMLVNKDFDHSQTMSFRLSGVDSLTELDKDSADGTLIPDYENGLLTRTFLPGEFALYELPEGKSYSTTQKPSDAPNLLLNAYATASDSYGADGWYIDNVNDGITVPTTLSKGWKSVSDAASQWLRFDLGEVKSFNRLDLYPGDNGSGAGKVSGAYFPGSITLEVSEDGETWTTVLSKTGLGNPDDACTFSFDQARGRYVRLTVSDLAVEKGQSIGALGEIQLFNDDGTLPPPEKPDFRENVALNKPVVDVSSSFEEAGNSKNNLTDGSRQSNYASDIGKNHSPDSEEWFTVDLQKVYTINEVVMTPFYHSYNNTYTTNCFPVGYKIQVSTDGETFTTVAAVDGKITEALPQAIVFKPAEARYVRVYATKLDQHTELGTYLMQLSEFEVYAGEEDLTPPTEPSTPTEPSEPTGPSTPTGPSKPSDPTGSGTEPGGQPTGDGRPTSGQDQTDPTGGADTGVTGSALPLALVLGGVSAAVIAVCRRKKSV